MTRRVRLGLLVTLLALLVAGCGKYGPPMRPGVAEGSAGGSLPAASGGGAAHPDDCRDPAHDHPEAGSSEGGAQGSAP